MGHLEGRVVKTTALPDILEDFEIQALARDRSGALWVSVMRKGVYRLLNDEWLAYGGSDALPRGTAIVETADSTGAIWFGYPGNRLARLAPDGAVRVFDVRDGLSVGNVMAIQNVGAQLYVGG